jgi:hypothetical protein
LVIFGCSMKIIYCSMKIIYCSRTSLTTLMLFISWYRRNHNFVILMYFISMSLIIFNLVLTNLIVNINLFDRPEKLREIVGSMDLSAGKYGFLALLHKISSVLSFVSIWLTTALLIHSSRDRLIKQIRYWVIPIMFLIFC